MGNLEARSLAIEVAGENTASEDEDRCLADALCKEAENPRHKVELLLVILPAHYMEGVDGPWQHERRQRAQ